MKYLDNEGNIYTTMKYRNKEGISLNYTSDDIHTRLVKEVITEACEIIYGGHTTEARLFLEENFNLENMGELKSVERR
jgi:hypothetical protein